MKLKNTSNYKQSVVLLISIMFIAMISALIVKNLDDSNNFIKSATNAQALTQLSVTIENLNKEILPFLSDNPENIEEIQSFFSIKSVTYGNVYVKVDMQTYPGEYDLVTIKNAKKLYYEELSKYVSYEYEFVHILQSLPEIQSQRQASMFINKYIKQTGDEQIAEIKDKFTFFETKLDGKKMQIYNIIYHIKISEKYYNVKLIYNIDKRKIEDFEFL